MSVALAWRTSAPGRLVWASPVLAIAQPHLPPLAALAALTLTVFWNDLVHGLVYSGGDTAAFYYPLTAWYAAQLRAGHLPLWFPHIFGGYPLFADGEIGMAYPLHLLFYSLLPGDQAFTWLRPAHFFLAGTFAYAFARTLAMGGLGSTVAGLTFAYGSFLVGHLEHENIVRSAVWVPLALIVLEHAYRREGRPRWMLLLACAPVLALQLLGVHVQPVLLSLMLYSLYALVAPLGPLRFEPIGRWRSAPRRRAALASLRGARPLRHCLARGSAVGLFTALGVGLAAVQLLPLYQLGERSLRAGGVSYEFSTSYSVPPVQLAQLLFPYLFRPDQSVYFGLWSAAETTIYVGIAPLLLALVGMAYVRTRGVLFFGLVAGGSLVLAMGDYLPLKLYSLIWSLPGFSYLRVPARFSLLLVLAAACLAGYGAAWLDRRRFDPTTGLRSLRVRRLAALALLFSLGAVALALLFVWLRETLATAPQTFRELIENGYLALRRADWTLTTSRVVYGLRTSLDLANPRTLGALVLMALVPLVLLLRGTHRLPCRLWRTAIVALVAFDLAGFAQGFYAQRRLAELRPTSPALQAVAGPPGMQRVFVEPELFQSFGPNRLVGASLEVAGGYSSLEPRRMSEFWWGMVRQDNVLLDLFNVRYVVAPRVGEGRQLFDGTSFHPVDRLMRGTLDNPSGFQRYEIEPTMTSQVTLIASVERLADPTFGTLVAELELGTSDGRSLALPVRFGIEVDDGSEPRLGPWHPDWPRTPLLAWVGPAFQRPAGHVSAVYGTTVRLPEPLEVTSVVVRRIGAPGILNLHGLGLRDQPGGPVRSLASRDNARYRSVYRDGEVEVLENTTSLPRAYFVGAARLAQPWEDGRSPVSQLQQDPYDPRTTVLLDPSDGPPLRPVQTPSSTPRGQASLREYLPERLTIDVAVDEPGYIVVADRHEEGWQAEVGGHVAPVLRANAVLRAVPVQPGDRQVVLRYDPPAVRVGLLITAATALALLLALLALFALHHPARAPRLPSFR